MTLYLPRMRRAWDRECHGSRRRFGAGRCALVIGLAGSLAALAIALAMPPEESVIVGGVGLVGTALVRAMAVAWSASLAVLTLLELRCRRAADGRRAVAPSALASPAWHWLRSTPWWSLGRLAAGGVVGVLVPGLYGWLDGTASSSPSR